VVAAAVVQFAMMGSIRWAGEAYHAIGVWAQIVLVWIVIVILASLASNRIGWLTRMITRHETAHLATLDLVGQLEIQNTLLKTLARSNDIGLAFQSLARQIARVVACDRLGLALVKENGQDLQTFTARVTEEERRNRPRPELEFTIGRTIIGNVGFRSALIVPLIAKNRALGTLNLVSRTPDAFVSDQLEAMAPIAEILAVGILAQQLQVSLGKYRTMETMAELTLSISNEINGAVQTIVGQCDLLERATKDEGLLRDLAVVISQAQRISDLLEKMRRTTQERLREVAATVSEAGVTSSPEDMVDDSQMM
jgi:hypothetical protein